MLLAKTYAFTTKANDLDKEEKLTKAVKYANQSPGIAEDRRKAQPAAARCPMDGSEERHDRSVLTSRWAFPPPSTTRWTRWTPIFGKVAELDADPTDLIRAGRVLIDTKKYEQAVPWFDKAASAPNANAQIKDIAAKDKARAQSMIKK